jgi:hypothetical protein
MMAGTLLPGYELQASAARKTELAAIMRKMDTHQRD